MALEGVNMLLDWLKGKYTLIGPLKVWAETLPNKMLKIKVLESNLNVTFDSKLGWIQVLNDTIQLPILHSDTTTPLEAHIEHLYS